MMMVMLLIIMVTMMMRMRRMMMTMRVTHVNEQGGDNNDDFVSHDETGDNLLWSMFCTMVEMAVDTGHHSCNMLQQSKHDNAIMIRVYCRAWILLACACSISWVLELVFCWHCRGYRLRTSLGCILRP